MNALSSFESPHSSSLKRRVLVVNHEETLTGAPRIALDVGSSLKEDFDVSVISMRKGGLHPEFKSTFDHIIYPSDKYGLFPSAEQISDMILQVNPDIVYVSTIVGHSYARVAKSLGYTVVMHVHELEHVFSKFFSQGIPKDFSSYADSFIVPTSIVSSFLQFSCNVSLDKILVVPEFIDIAKITTLSMQESVSSVKSRLNIPSDNIVICAVASFIYRKGADIFIELANTLEKEYPGKYHFLWIGYLEKHHRLEFPRLNIPSNVTLVSETQNPFIYLNVADFFVLPSREDPFPLSVLEALSLGKPSLIFDGSGGMCDVIKNAGLLVPEMSATSLASEISRVSLDKSLCKELSRLALLHSSSYDLPKVVSSITSHLASYFQSSKSYNPLYSVFLPVIDNSYLDLRKTIDSLLRQPFHDFELLVYCSNILNPLMRDYLEKLNSYENICVFFSTGTFSLDSAYNYLDSFALGDSRIFTSVGEVFNLSSFSLLPSSGIPSRR